MEVNRVNWQRLTGLCLQFGFRQMASESALMLPTGAGTSARFGKWTGMEMDFARSFRIGKELSIAVETGRPTANIIISRRAAEAHRESGCCQGILRSFEGRLRARRA